MVRELKERDIAILTKLAPEFSGEACSSSGVPYRSIIPPVANHYAVSADDFRERIHRLTPEELTYLIELIQSGEESLHCLSGEYFDILYARVTELISMRDAHLIASVYAEQSEL